MGLHKPTKLAFIILLILALVVSGCAKSDPQPGGQISVAIVTEPMTLNPLMAKLPEERQISAMVFEGLIANDDQGELVGILAERWLVSDDRLHWTFELREGICWHDGQPFTAYDVEFTFNLLAFHEELAQPQVRDILEAVLVEDENTITFVLNQPHGPFVQSAMAPILPRHIYDPELYNDETYQAPTDIHPLAQTPVGTGPWTVEKWVPGDYIQMEQYPDYNRGEMSQLQTIYFHFYDNYQAAIAALLAGKLDMVPDIPAPEAAQLDPTLGMRYRLLETITPEYWYLAFNLRQEVFTPGFNFWSQVQVRQAVANALDRDKLIQQAANGFGTVLQAPFVPGSWASTGQAPMYSYSPDSAAALLREANWDFSDVKAPELRSQNRGSEALPVWQRLELTLTYAEDMELAPVMAETIKADLEAVGFKVNLNPQPWQIVLDEYATPGMFELVLLQGTLSQEPAWDLDNIVASGQTANYGGYNSPYMDELLELGRTTISREIRAQIYKDVEAELNEKLPILPLFVPHTVTVARKDLQIKRAIIGLSNAKNWYLVD